MSVRFTYFFRPWYAIHTNDSTMLQDSKSVRFPDFPSRKARTFEKSAHLVEKNPLSLLPQPPHQEHVLLYFHRSLLMALTTTLLSPTLIVMSDSGDDSSPGSDTPAFGAGGTAIPGPPVAVPPHKRGSRDHYFLKSKDPKLLFLMSIGLGE
jgi:hypothetical protein